jgi:hypothetical protein
MTTLVTVKANGPCYPARVVKKDNDGQVLEDRMIASGFTYELHVAAGQSIEVTEEYHQDGYPPPGPMKLVPSD